MYEYTSVEVPLSRKLKTRKGDTFKTCMEIIHKYARNGWRLVQVVIPANEKTGIATQFAYEILFEKKINV